MSDSLMTIVAIFLAAILMFVFPLAAISEMNDNEVAMVIQSYTDEFVNDSRSTGKITKDDYESYVQDLYSTGNTYEVEFEVLIADANPSIKTNSQLVGDTVFYGLYTDQVMAYIDDPNYDNSLTLKEGDYITVSVKNTNQTISQMIKSFLYGLTGDESYVITAQASGVVVSTGVRD